MLLVERRTSVRRGRRQSDPSRENFDCGCRDAASGERLRVRSSPPERRQKELRSADRSTAPPLVQQRPQPVEAGAPEANGSCSAPDFRSGRGSCCAARIGRVPGGEKTFDRLRKTCGKDGARSGPEWCTKTCAKAVEKRRKTGGKAALWEDEKLRKNCWHPEEKLMIRCGCKLLIWKHFHNRLCNLRAVSTIYCVFA
jgi:hypothetical protein